MGVLKPLVLPETWSVEWEGENRQVLRKSAPNGECIGFVSVDWAWRTFETGFIAMGLLKRRKDCDAFEGRGWREALLAAAMTAVEEPGF